MAKIASENEFRELLSKGNLPPVCLWIGEEDFLKSEALFFLRCEAPKKALNFEVYSACEYAPSEILGRAATPSFLGAKTHMVLTEVERCGPTDRAFLKRYAENPLVDLTLILVLSSGTDSDADFIQTLAQRAGVLEFPILAGKDLLAWAIKKAKAVGLVIEEKALSGLAEGFGGQLGRLSSELEKLSLFHPEEGRVSVCEIEEILGPSVWETSQRITQAVKEGRVRESLQAWEDQRLWGDRPENILTSLFYEAASLPGSEESLEALYHADLSLKTGALAEGVLMPLVIARIVHPTYMKEEENRNG